MDLEFSVTEKVTRDYGQISKIEYQFEEFTFENVLVGITHKKERRSRIYDTQISRDYYNRLAEKIPAALSFDNFVIVLCPFLMGYYEDDQLEKAFQVLDTNHSGSIHVDELATFLPIINEFATTDSLTNYIKKVDVDHDGNLTYDEFRSLVLKGIGRDIICNHL